MRSGFPRRSALIMAAPPLSCALSACFTVRQPIQGVESEETKQMEQFGPVGYVGITSRFSPTALKGSPTLVVEIVDLQGAKSRLIVETGDRFGVYDGNKEAGKKAFLFALPEGKYRPVRILLRSPGGTYDGQRFRSSSLELPLSQRISEFEVKKGRFLHMGTFMLSVEQSGNGGEALTRMWTHGIDFDAPDSKNWSRFQPRIGTLECKSAIDARTGSAQLMPCRL